MGCLIFTGHVLQKSPIISGFFAKHDLQLGAQQAPEPLRATGVGPEPLWMVYPRSFHFSNFFEIGRPTRAISNRASPPDVQCQISHLLPAASWLHV